VRAMRSNEETTLVATRRHGCAARPGPAAGVEAAIISWFGRSGAKSQAWIILAGAVSRHDFDAVML